MAMTLAYYYIGMDLDSDGDADILTEAAITLMKRNLPTYISNSFIAAGYDTLPVIAEMDISDKPGNSLQVIEEYISKEYPNDPRFYRSNMTCTFFPPGHRQRIERFVKQVKEQLEEEKQLKRKRRVGSCNTAGMSKRGKSGGDTSSNSSDSHPSPLSIAGDIRRQVAKWQRQQKDEKLRKLKEHQHFEVKVSENQGGSTDVSVSCLVCGKSSTRGQKHGKVLISNWTRHATKCVDSRQFSGTTPHMQRLDEHFSQSRTSLSSSGHASVSSPSSPELFSPVFQEQGTMHDKSESEIVAVNQGIDTQGGVSKDIDDVVTHGRVICEGVSGRVTEGTQETMTDGTWHGSHGDTCRSDTEEVFSESGVTQGRATEGTQGTGSPCRSDTEEVVSESGVTRGRVTEDTRTGVTESIYKSTQEIASENACQDVSVNHSFRLSPLVAKDTSQQSFQRQGTDLSQGGILKSSPSKQHAKIANERLSPGHFPDVVLSPETNLHPGQQPDEENMESTSVESTSIQLSDLPHTAGKNQTFQLNNKVKLM